MDSELADFRYSFMINMGIHISHYLYTQTVREKRSLVPKNVLVHLQKKKLMSPRIHGQLVCLVFWNNFLTHKELEEIFVQASSDLLEPKTVKLLLPQCGTCKFGDTEGGLLHIRELAHAESGIITFGALSQSGDPLFTQDFRLNVRTSGNATSMRLVDNNEQLIASTNGFSFN